jgi:hypothetical protein
MIDLSVASDSPDFRIWVILKLIQFDFIVVIQLTLPVFAQYTEKHVADDFAIHHLPGQRFPVPGQQCDEIKTGPGIVPVLQPQAIVFKTLVMGNWHGGF